VLTKDTRIRYRTAELAALMRSGVTAFVLTSGNLRGAEMAEIFLKALPAIYRLMARYAPPFVASVTKSGSVSLLVRSSQKKAR